MSIERQYGNVMLVCDECGENTEAEEGFGYMIETASADGWLITKDEDTDEWTHLCPDCVRKLPKIS